MIIKKYELYKYVGKTFTVGLFLKNQSPGNTTYCNFRLGDSVTFNYTDNDVSYSPELGEKGPYRILYSVVKGFQYNNTETNSVTYVTHITLEFLFHIVEIAKRWSGPISVACFLPGTDTILALKVLEKMCFCVKEMENVDIHFIYPKDHPPKLMSLKNYSFWLDMEEYNMYTPWKMIETNSVQKTSDNNNNNNTYINDNKTNIKTTTTTSATTNTYEGTCYVPEKILKNSYKSKKNLVYPINVARNVARYGSRSKFILVSDIELLPSDNLVNEFLNMIKRLNEKNKHLGEHYFTKKKYVSIIIIIDLLLKDVWSDEEVNFSGTFTFFPFLKFLKLNLMYQEQNHNCWICMKKKELFIFTGTFALIVNVFLVYKDGCREKYILELKPVPYRYYYY